MTVFGGLDEFFAPGRRHIEEERRREALTRVDPGDADPARGPVDLSSGRVTIRLPRPADGSGRTGDTAPDPAAEDPEPARGRGEEDAAAEDPEVSEGRVTGAEEAQGSEDRVKGG
ncbi:DUF6191 domain-containing protein [Streptomyces sp. NPDC002232]|uniref:DUF6191 domain-containing protein n=1 Tax=Streptomyces sp. NPDC002232 TaxID=3364640 RepID=UPI0036979A4A